MKSIHAFFQASAAELKNLRSLTLASFLAAIYAVSYAPFAGNIIIVPGLVEIRLGFLAIAVAAMMFGPIVASMVALIGDFLGTIFFYGGSFVLGYTVTWVLMGFAFGCFLYKNRVTIPRMLGAMIFYTVVINLFITTLLQSLLGYGAFWPLFYSRLVFRLIMFPVNTILLILVLRSVDAVYHRIGRTAYTK